MKKSYRILVLITVTALASAGLKAQADFLSKTALNDMTETSTEPIMQSSLCIGHR